MKNYLKIIFEKIFTRKKINKKGILKLLENRIFLNKSLDILSFLPYKNISVQESIRELKFKNNIQNADFFAEILLENIPEYLSELEIKENFYNPILITVPISFLRKIKRGYNQNDLIIESFMKNGGKNFIK
jgi:predicted amidophosphoribosyltransferase